jgi:hypothetical protein
VTEHPPANTAATTLQAWGRAAPVVALFLVPAIIAELLYGSTPITNPTPLLPEIVVYCFFASWCGGAAVAGSRSRCRASRSV